VSEAPGLIGGQAVSARELTDDRQAGVAALYQAHSVGLIRLAVVMLGDRPAAEDVVQDAFAGLFRRYSRLTQPERALQYVRSSVLNGCRSELRAKRRAAQHPARALAERPAASAEQDALIGVEHRQVLAALRRLPDRQREVIVLRYFLDLSPAEITTAMRISPGTVKSTTSRALAALARMMGEQR
jgi:RNA polymerase sigma-70 factor (sigma-E family)